MSRFQQQGLTVRTAEQLPHSSYPFFSVNAERLIVNGENVYAFDYPNAGSAARDAHLVSSSGAAIGTTMVDWVDTPHFYTGPSIIALYVGKSDRVLRALADVLGPQFAGGM